LQQQLATLQANHKEVLHLLKEQEEQVARLKRELQDGREQAAAAQDLVKGLQLENARYGCGRERESAGWSECWVWLWQRERAQDGVSAEYGCSRERAQDGVSAEYGCGREGVQG